jgi:hypothetical protein
MAVPAPKKTSNPVCALAAVVAKHNTNADKILLLRNLDKVILP